MFGNSLEILNDEKEVKATLSSFYEGNETKVEAACYLLNRALVTDVVISKEFLSKVYARISERMSNAKGQDLKNLVYERNFVYSQIMKHNKHKKKLNIPKSCPDKIVGSRMYAGLNPTQNN